MSPFDFNSHAFQSEEFKSVVAAAVEFFSHSPEYRLPPQDRFPGSGVYALYYVGNFQPYASLCRLNQNTRTKPIYVGKAVPKGWRQARNTDSNAPTLFGRLKHHASNIAQTQNLSVKDFYCRFVILGGEEIDLISTVEAQLIRTHMPLWNSVIDGFGNHAVGKNRVNQILSEWDTLHPGRSWTKKWQGKRPAKQSILKRIKEALD